MRKYEIMYILKADLADEARTEVMNKLHSILTQTGGSVTNVNEWGLRDFAYPINDEPKGYYVVIKVTTDKEALNEFERLVRFNQNVVRHLVTIDQD